MKIVHTFSAFSQPDRPPTPTAGGDFLIESISSRTHAYEMLHEQMLEGVAQKERDLRDMIDQVVDRVAQKPGEGRHLRFYFKPSLSEISSSSLAAAAVPSALKGKGHPILERDGK